MRITIIEDNRALASAIAYRLRDRGHSADIIHDGGQAAEFLKQEGADLVILDINLPGKNGLDVLKELRGEGVSTPVILLTARSETQDLVTGLDSGADDYLTKPFEMDELEARVRALSRRRNLNFGSLETLGPLQFDKTQRQVLHEGENIEIPRRELATFECLLERRGRLVSKAQLTDYVYGVGADVEETVIEPHISRLRKRLCNYGVQIKTARGLGYMLALEEE
ncbi:response regulator transcription factor [Rhodobacteraceae bacterium RKSG542]|uniref:response regulator transcription factor n=1 Tax=Pseudovibrio flavus TaxID=2529854 RepID=UPI0012BBB801|nr:response regulator transcription factor [Pseudovibrio flavus]MTI18100.1 response regulator transcription factor [Pseudovibrio flavus]